MNAKLLTADNYKITVFGRFVGGDDFGAIGLTFGEPRHQLQPVCAFTAKSLGDRVGMSVNVDLRISQAYRLIAQPMVTVDV